MAQGVSPQAEINLLDLWQTIRCRKNIIQAFGLIAFAASLLVVLLMPKQYEAQALVMLHPAETNLFNPSENTLIKPPEESIILSEVEVLQSRDVAEAVVNDMKLAENPLFWEGSVKPFNPATAKETAIARLANNLKIKPVMRSLVIDIRYRHPNAMLAAKIVNRLVELYQQQQVQQKIDYAEKTGAWLDGQLKTLSEKLRASSQAVEEYRTRENLIDGKDVELTSQQISEMGSQMVSAQADLAVAQAKRSQLDSVIESKKPLDSISDIMNSHMVSILEENETTIRGELAELQSKYGPRHPRVLAAQSELAEIGQKKLREMSRFSEKINNDLMTAKARNDALQKNLDQLEEKRRRENKSAIGLRELQREVDANRKLYESLLTRYKEVSAMREMQQPDAKVISLARIPSRATGAPDIVIVFMATFFGLIFGALLAFIMEQGDYRVRTPEQLKQIAGLPVLSFIPQDDNIAGKVLDQPQSSMADAVRSLRIRLFSGANPPKILALASCLSGEGKIGTTLALGRILAASGQKVLLVDGDFRRPGLHKLLTLTPLASVAEIILGKRSLDTAITRDSRAHNLSVLVGQPSSQADLDMLSQPVIRTFLESQQSSYDVILVDTPSFLSVAESQLVLQACGNCVFFVGWGRVPYHLVESTVAQIRHDGIGIEGFVLSRISAEAYAQYRYGSDYYPREERLAA